MFSIDSMKLKTFLVVCVLLNLSFCGNIFYEKLNQLLDYCLTNRETVDAGTLLGIAFAKGQLLGPSNERLIKKCEKLQNKFVGEENVKLTFTEIGEKRLINIQLKYC